jgi:hypothetical protein
MTPASGPTSGPSVVGTLVDDAPAGASVCAARRVTLVLTAPDGTTHQNPQIQASSGGCSLEDPMPALATSISDAHLIVARCQPSCAGLPSVLTWLQPDASSLDGLSVAALPDGTTLDYGPEGTVQATLNQSDGATLRVLEYDADDGILQPVHQIVAAASTDPARFDLVAVTPADSARAAALNPGLPLLAGGNGSVSSPDVRNLIALSGGPSLTLAVLGEDGSIVRPPPANGAPPCQLGVGVLERGSDYPRVVVARCTDSTTYWVFPEPELNAPSRPTTFPLTSTDTTAPRYDSNGILELVETLKEGGAYPRTAVTLWRYSDDDGGFDRSTTTYVEPPSPASLPAH